MKKLKQNPTIKNKILTACLLMMSLFINAQDVKPKNNISLGAGISVPLLTSSDFDSEAIASNGSNFSISYGREIYGGKKGYFTLDARYSVFSNPYNQLDADTKVINKVIPNFGTWSGTSDSYKLSSYLLGASWYQYISNDDKWTCFFKFYVGSGSLVAPAESFTTTSGLYINKNEEASSAFVYSTCGGISYDITKNISLGVNVEFLKSNFAFGNQKLTASGGSSQAISPYTIDYSNLGINTGLAFKF
jgi:opacity protein-like surface antigen